MPVPDDAEPDPDLPAATDAGDTPGAPAGDEAAGDETTGDEAADDEAVDGEAVDDEVEGIALDLDEIMAGADPVDDLPPGHRSGFVALVGRPNVGKSTLLNAICGEKVSITSDRPETTRYQVRGVRTRDNAQIVFVDTPGIHRPKTPLGERLNDSAEDALAGVDVVCHVIDATKPVGPGDRWVAERVPDDAVVVVNKVDRATPAEIAAQLAAVSEWDREAYFAISARTGNGVVDLVDHLVDRLPEGPRWYPGDVVRDLPEAVHVAELVREQIVRRMHEELPHSVATRVTEWEWPRIRVEIVVERSSQKGMVIGKGGRILKEVGTAVRRQLPKGTYLELHVAVDEDWQQRPDRNLTAGFDRDVTYEAD